MAPLHWEGIRVCTWCPRIPDAPNTLCSTLREVGHTSLSTVVSDLGHRLLAFDLTSDDILLCLSFRHVDCLLRLGWFVDLAGAKA
jgi:hypothetical protein